MNFIFLSEIPGLVLVPISLLVNAVFPEDDIFRSYIMKISNPTYLNFNQKKIF
jgi:hypothetical protein